MEYKKFEVYNERTRKTLSCICVHYDRLLEVCERFVLKRYQKFQCNPKYLMKRKAAPLLDLALLDEEFLPNLFSVRLGKKQSVTNGQISFVFELLDKSFFEQDELRQSELSEETRALCLFGDVDFVIFYVGLNQ